MSEFLLTGVTTLDQALDRIVSTFPERKALVHGDTEVSYRELGERIHALAAGLRRQGLTKGDRVAIILPNCFEFVYAFFAVGKAGGTIVPINPMLRERELAHILNDAEVAVAIVAPEVWGNDVVRTLERLRPELPHLRNIIVHGDARGADALSLAEVIASGAGETVQGIAAPDDIFGLIYTSGTTGTAKGAIHAQRTVLAPILAAERLRQTLFERPSLRQMAQLARTMSRSAGRFMRYAGKPQTLLSPSPFHAMAGYGAVLNAIMFGFRFVIVERFHPVRILELVEQQRVNVLVGAPTMFAMMMALPDFDRYDLSSLLYCTMSLAPAPPPLVRKVRQRFGCPVMIAFGATEISGPALITRMDDPDEMQVASVGRATSDATIKIVDEQRRELPPGQVGELACRMDSIMLGYYKAPEATAEAIDADGWYYTGDLATIDERGYVRIVGRKKDMIIRGGQNIFPAEIETFLQSHPKIQLAAVVGVPDALSGEAVWAFVLPKPGLSLSPQEVLDHCRGQVVPYKVPSVVRIVSELPMTATAKLQKFRLREMAIAELRTQGVALPEEEFFIGADQ
jgi:fatty-acyl-CoA synthase